MSIYTKLGSLALQYVKTRAAHSVADIVAPIGPMLEHASKAAIVVVTSVASFLFMLLFLAIAAFCALADASQWAMAGLWTGLFFGVFGGILLGYAISLFRKLRLTLNSFKRV